MPFGHTNAPATFQKMINNVLREYLDIFVVVYLDDILIFSESEKQHEEHVHKVLKALQDAKLLVEPEKSKWHTHEVDFLGHTISPGEIRMQKEKLAPVKDWPTPKTVKEVQSFLGFANYYRRFILGFSKIATALHDLTKSTTQFEWNDKTQKSFEQVKEALLQEPVLVMFDPSKPIELETDASDYALGGQIGQPDENGKIRPIAFYSKKLHGAELNYPIYDKEFLAIINCFKEFRHYLQGSQHKVKVYTDHKNIAYFATAQVLNSRQIRWAEILSEFDYEIIHRKGSENGRADALSRRSDYDTGREIQTGKLLELANNGNYVQRQHLNTLYKVTADTTISDMIRSHVDGWIKEQRPSGVNFASGLPIYEDSQLVWIPTGLRQAVIKKIHEHPSSGHQGIRKTLERVKRNYDCPNLRKEVEETVNNCTICGRNKTARHKPYGGLKPLPIPDKPWDSISMDFVVKLPPSKDPVTHTTYDAILVVVDRLTKYAHFIPYQEATDAKGFAHIMTKEIISKHGMPQEIISDRGPPFTSKFWQTFTGILGTNHKLSTAYHPETNGQTERTNQTMETYLRCYINYPQDNWVELLPMAQLAYNTSISESTGEQPAKAMLGYEPTLLREARQTDKNPAGLSTASERTQMLKQMKETVRQEQAKLIRNNEGKNIEGPT